MPAYNYQCLYCNNCDLCLANLDDDMTLCSKCGNLMVRSDNDSFWDFFDKTHFLFSTAANRPGQTSGDDTLSR